MSNPRWLADEMVGRLARYLRFVGCDTAYVRGLLDDEVLARAEREDRILLTRDRELARRAGRVVLLTSPRLADQWKQVRSAVPTTPGAVAFVRCTVCNGLLVSYTAGGNRPDPDGVPWDRVAQGLRLYQCSECGHLYWEGSHTARVRQQIANWSGETRP